MFRSGVGRDSLFEGRVAEKISLVSANKFIQRTTSCAPGIVVEFDMTYSDLEILNFQNICRCQ